MEARARKATESHNHIWRLIELLAVRAYDLKPGLAYFHVEHDRWCHIFKGGFCNCDPVVSMKFPMVENLEQLPARERFIEHLKGVVSCGVRQPK